MRREQRRRQNRNHRDVAPHTLVRNATALDRVGKQESQRYGNQRCQQRKRQRVPGRLRQCRRLHVLNEVRQADEVRRYDPRSCVQTASPAAPSGKRTAQAPAAEFRHAPPAPRRPVPNATGRRDCATAARLNSCRSLGRLVWKHAHPIHSQCDIDIIRPRARPSRASDSASTRSASADRAPRCATRPGKTSRG